MSQPTQDVVDLLTQQHEQIRRLFTEVEDAPVERRQAAFDRLRKLLSVHESAEEQVVHPAVRHAIGDGGQQIIEALLQEETTIKKVLAQLEKMDVASPEFMARLVELRDAVLAHVEHEEKEEFPRLRANVDQTKREQMVSAVKTAETMAPTHPHPRMGSAAKNSLLGPFAAMVDRVRDALSRRG